MSIITQPYFYILVLIVSLAGLSLLDWQRKLVIWRDKSAAIKTWAILIVFFLAWDVAGIILEIFSTNSAYTIGINLGTPNLPIEEFLFLSLLIYTSLLTYELAVRFLRSSRLG